MNIKTRLTLAMWALPMSFMMVTLGTTPSIILTGSILIFLQMIVWGKLLGEIEEKNK